MNNTIVQLAVFLIGAYLISALKSGEQAQWRIMNKITKFGDNLTLVCILNKTLENQQETLSKRWYNGPDVCSINDRTTNSTKYLAWVDDEGAKLTILNFHLQDVNQTYYCEIGFYKSTKLILTTEIVFQEKKTSSEKQFPKNEFNITAVHLTNIFIGIGSLVLVIPLLGCCLKIIFKKKTSRQQHMKYRHDGETPESPESVPLGHTESV